MSKGNLAVFVGIMILLGFGGALLATVGAISAITLFLLFSPIGGILLILWGIKKLTNKGN